MTLYYTYRVYPTSGYDNYKIYAPNREAASYTSQLLTRIKRHTDKNTLIVGEFNTPLSEIEHPGKSKQRVKGFECHTRLVGPHRYI